MKQRLLSCGLLLCLSGFSLVGLASDLLDVYALALKNDPTLKGAKSSQLSNKEAWAQARANLLPTITSDGQQSVFRDVETVSSGARSNVRGDTRRYAFDLTQPVINWGNWMQLIQAKAVVRQADAAFQADIQDLIIRVSQAYFNVLEAEDFLRFTTMERKANERQLDQAKQRYKVGLDAVTSVYDAQASFDAVRSREITAGNDLVNSREALREITGSYESSLAKLRKNFPLNAPKESVDALERLALEKNNALTATRHEADAAKYGVKVVKAGHIPSLNLVASYSDQTGAQVGGGSFDTTTKQVNLELVVPIFEGGSVFSRTRQAAYDFQATLAKLDATQKDVVSSTRQLYNSIISGISTVKADKQAVKSTTASAESTEAAFKVGTRTMVDVLDKQKDVYDAQRQLSSSQYKFINDTLALKQATGTLSEADLERVNGWLHSRTHRARKLPKQRKPVAKKTYRQTKAKTPTQPKSVVFISNKSPATKQATVKKASQPAVAKKVAPKSNAKTAKVVTKSHHKPVKAKQTIVKPNVKTTQAKTTPKTQASIVKKTPVKKQIKPTAKKITKAKPGKKLYLQVAAFRSADHAKAMQKRLQKETQQRVAIISANTRNGELMHSVRVGPIADAKRVYQLHDKIQAKGLGDAIVMLR